MKKILFASLAVVALASCKKSYVCTCIETDTSGGLTTVSTNTVEIKDVKKKYVETATDCVSYDAIYVSGGSTSTTKVDCTIDKK